jgi:hypothetical protein
MELCAEFRTVGGGHCSQTYENLNMDKFVGLYVLHALGIFV